MTISEIKAHLPHKERFDYFLIWGHGQKYEEQILKILRDDKQLEIIMVNYHTPVSMAALVEEMYSHDYAPIEHLRGKTRYLEQVPLKATFIFVKNIQPEEEYVGEGEFRHIECAHIRRIKNHIRDLYNPREQGKRTEHHVIHASDNEAQTHHALIYLGYPKGVLSLMAKPHDVLDLPYHLGNFSKFSLEQIDLDQINGLIIETMRNGFKHVQVPIDQTPHFKSLSQDRSHYDKYRRNFKQVVSAIDDHFWANFKRLKNIKYLTGKYANSYILVEKNASGKYIIRDGLHRASVLKNQGVKSIIAAVIIE